MSQRNEWVDNAKAIGITLVVMGHVQIGLDRAGIPLNETFTRTCTSVIYSFHMPLFFLLSGLFLTPSLQKRTTASFILSKVDTIVYPYVLWSICQTAVEVLLSAYTSGNSQSGDILKIFWEPRAQFWFLYALFIMFASTALFLKFRPQKILPVLTVLATVAYILRGYFQIPDLLARVVENYCYFLLGATITVYKISIDKLLGSIRVTILLGAVFLLAQILFLIFLGGNNENKNVYTLFIGTLSVAFVLSLSLCLSKRPSKSLLAIGQGSMEIYILHILIGSGIRIVLQKILGIENAILHWTAGMLLGMLFPLMARHIVSKYNIPYVFKAPVSRLFLSGKS